MNFIIYQITNKLNNKIYIGSHQTVNINDKYMGSSKSLKKDIKEMGKENFNKEILFVFDNKKEMLLKEEEIVNKEFVKRSDTYNLYPANKKFTTIGMTCVKDNEGNITFVYIDDERYLSGELVGVNKGRKGKINVVDQNNNLLRVYSDDERYLSGELTHLNKNKVSCKDENNVTYFVDKNDKRLKSGILMPCFTNRNHSNETKNKIGLANSKKQKGTLNSQFGTCWITNGIENKKIKKDDLDNYLKSGWTKGRKMGLVA
jgi:hypothetical protein